MPRSPELGSQQTPEVLRNDTERLRDDPVNMDENPPNLDETNEIPVEQPLGYTALAGADGQLEPVDEGQNERVSTRAAGGVTGLTASVEAAGPASTEGSAAEPNELIDGETVYLRQAADGQLGAADGSQASVDRTPSPYARKPDQPDSPELRDRIDRHRPQGDNSVVYGEQGHEQAYNFEGTCGLASGAQALSDATGRQVTERDLVERATTAPNLRGTVRTPAEGGNASSWGGTTAAGRDRIYKDFGAETYMDSGWDVNQLADTVESGDSVLANVNSDRLWNGDDATNLNGPDHVVYVIGTERGAGGEVTGFVANDTGLPGHEGAGARHDTESFTKAWEQQGGRVNVIIREKS